MKLEKLLRIPILTKASLLSLGLVGSAYGQAVIYEPFDYTPDGSRLNTYTQSATGLSVDWSDTGTLVGSPGLAYGTLVSSGNMVTMSDDTSWVDTGTTLDGLLDDGDTLWFSVLVRPHSLSTNPDFGFALATNQGSDSNNVPISGGEGMGFRFKGGLKATTWIGNPTSGSNASGVSAGEVTLIVGEMIFAANPLDPDTINIYLPDETLTLGSALSTQSAVLDQTVFDTITFMNKAASPRDEVDEIRFGTSAADVLPADATAPSLVSIEDNVFGGPIYTDTPTITYTVLFDQAIDPATVDTSDFATTGTATTAVDSVTQTGPTTFEVVVSQSSAGDVTLEIPIGATILDFAAQAVDTTSAIQDDTTITIVAGASPAMTFLGTVDTDWNDVANWDGGGATTVVPFGAYPAIINTGVTAVANDSTIPTYSGGLTFLANSELDIFSGDGNRNAIGTGPITFNTGSTLRLRSGGDEIIIPGDITMAGDATITNSSNSTDNENRTLSGVISGTGLLTFEVRRGNTVTLSGANTWSGGFVFNYVDNNFGNGSRVRPGDSGFGTGDVTINDGLQLHIQSGLSDTIDDSASLFLNGRGRDDSPLDNKLFLESNETVNELWVDNTTGDGTTSVQLPAGDYTATTSPGGGGAILDSNGDALIKGSGTLTVLSGPGAGAPYGTWTGTFGGLSDTNPELDFDGGGLDTGLEWVLDGDPTDSTDDAGIAPTGDNSDPTYFTFTYRRSDDANADGDTAIAVEYGNDLTGWTTAVHDGVNIIITENDDAIAAGVDEVVVQIDKSLAGGTEMFVRLNVTVTTP